MREADLEAWVKSCLEEEFQFSPVSGDAGFRNYYRITRKAGAKPQTMIAVDASPETEKNQEFLQVAEYLARAELPVPQIHFHDLDHGFFLLEDLGHKDLSHVLSKETVSDSYQRSMGILLQMSVLSRPEFLESYSAEKLLFEMDLFPEWFLNQLLLQGEVKYDAAPWQAQWPKLTALLVQSATKQPQIFVHRDFHSRNILCSGGGGLGLIDFQDAVWGPLTYDLVSLLKDCYVRWPREEVVEWAFDFHYHWSEILQKLQNAGDAPSHLKAIDVAAMSKETFLRAFDLMGLQRHIKVMGIFARLWLRDKKPGYLADLPRVLDYIIEVCECYDELSFVLPLFDDLRGVMNQNALRTLFHPYRH